MEPTEDPDKMITTNLEHELLNENVNQDNLNVDLSHL